MQTLSERIEWCVDGAIDSLDREIDNATEILNDADPSDVQANRIIVLEQFEAQLLQKLRNIRKEIDTLSKT